MTLQGVKARFIIQAEFVVVEDKGFRKGFYSVK
jgi:hypothetical protein